MELGGQSSNMAETGTGSGSGDRRSEEAAKLLDRLNLQDEEVDDLVWEEEIDVEEIKPKWLALGRLLTTKSFSQSALIADMKAAWNSAQQVVWRRIDGNLFSIQFNCLGDWNKAMHQGPWDFKGSALLLAEYDGFANPEKVRLDKLETWCQIHKLPDGVLKSQSALKNLASRIGEVQEVQVTLPNGFIGEFIRVRVKLDVNKKLTRAVGITRAGQTEKYLVKFEKLPTFCHACGFMGHWYEECGTGEHDKTKFEWGPFILAARRGRGGGRGSRGEAGRRSNMDDDDTEGVGRGVGRGFGRGRGAQADINTLSTSWRFNAAQQPVTSDRMEEDENRLTPSIIAPGIDERGSAPKDNFGGSGNFLGKRSAENSSSTGGGGLAIVPVGKVKQSIVSNLIVRYEEEDEIPDSSANQGNTPQKNANRKKMRGENGEALRNEEEKSQSTDQERSAAPTEGDRREQ